MSDALTDIAREEERAKAYAMYIFQLRKWLLNQTPENRSLVSSSAEKVDSVVGGYWGRGKTNIGSKVDEMLCLLATGDKKTWLSYVFQTWQDDDLGLFHSASNLPLGSDLSTEMKNLTGEDAYRIIKSSSPFHVMSMIFFLRGNLTYDCHNSMGEVSPEMYFFFRNKLSSLCWRIGDSCDQYAFVVSPKWEIEVYWLGNNSHCKDRRNGPEK